MGMKLLAYDPFISSERAEQLGCQLVELNVLFQQADYITLHIPKTKETANIINAKTLALMKPTTRIINCARGGIIDEAALAVAIRDGVIAGAALDVFEAEPLPLASRLRKLSCCIFGSHNGSNTVDAVQRASLRSIELISGFLSQTQQK